MNPGSKIALVKMSCPVNYQQPCVFNGDMLHTRAILDDVVHSPLPANGDSVYFQSVHSFAFTHNGIAVWR